MDPQHSAQDVLRCDLCETPVPPMYCDICQIKLCKACVGEHISDLSREHKVVPFEKRGSTINYPKCKMHSYKTCELNCDQCDIPVCAQCVSSGEHFGHRVVEIIKILNDKKESIRNDLKEMEEIIYPNYQQAASNIPVQKVNARKHSKKLTNALKKQGESVHREIDTVIKKMQSDIDNMDSKHLAMIDKQEKAINHSITEIEQVILDLRKLLDNNDANLLSDYKSRNEEFRRLPVQFQVTLPVFTPQEINREQIQQHLGSLSKQIITTEKHAGPMKTTVAESSTQVRLLLDEPRLLTKINTEYGKVNELHSASCLSDFELWTCGRDIIMRLYNIQGELLKTVQTRSGNWPQDMTVTQSRDLVYTDFHDSSINMVKNTQVELLIRPKGWQPINLCSTSTGDLLVSMVSDDKTQSKVVRYTDSKEKQNIQWDDQGKPLYSSDAFTKYLSENRNLDICMADYFAGAVVVVSVAGKLRFRYTGPPSTTKVSKPVFRFSSLPSTNKKPFKPEGITTDSQRRILTSDPENDCIHILDQDGRFLRFIDNCGLQSPMGLCLDSRENLFVTECLTGKVKRIQYSK